MKPITVLTSKLLSAFRTKNQRHLRKLSDEVVKLAAQDFTPINFQLAVFSYVLAKIVSKPRYLASESISSLNAIESVFADIAAKIESGNDEQLLQGFSKLEKTIASLEAKDPRFIIDLVTKGKLKIAAIFYAQGMSLGVAADVTGLEKQEILDYAGATMMFDRIKEEKPIEERMKSARKFLAG